MATVVVLCKGVAGIEIEARRHARILRTDASGPVFTCHVRIVPIVLFPVSGGGNEDAVAVG